MNRFSSIWTLVVVCAYDNQFFGSSMHDILVLILWLDGGK
jgi:hypothetical protein